MRGFAHVGQLSIIGLAAAAMAACAQPGSPMVSPAGSLAGPSAVQTGNGGPNGNHFTLNLIGVPNTKTADMTGGGSRIFVSLTGLTKILLAPGSDFEVLDPNGTDGEASFQLPNPDPTNSGTTTYSVFARALGKPGGSSTTTTCATDPSDGALVCSVISLTLTRTSGKTKFENVSKDLLYIYADIGSGPQRFPLFDSALQNFFWQYDNTGLKLAQLRFYPCSTTVPGATNPGGSQTTTCF